MKPLLFSVLMMLTATGFAQSKACGCRIKDGSYSLTVDGIVTFKGKSKEKIMYKGMRVYQYHYDLNLSFKNEQKCPLVVDWIMIGDGQIKANVNLEPKKTKKGYKNTLTLPNELETEIGLDDMVFAPIMVRYTLSGETCSHEVTVGYTKNLKK